MDPEGALESSRNASTSFIRLIALSIAFYDYLLTLPAEWRFYRSQRSWRLSLGCILFIAIRYSSIAVLTLSNVGYFGNFFSPAACSRYFIAAPIFKVLQAMISQLILGIRTINISRRSRLVTWIITTVFLLCTTAQWILNLWNRVPVQGRRNNCTAGNKPPVLTVWLYYLLAMAFDILTLSISSIYLISFSPNSGKMAHLRRIMLTDGLIYFVALTGVNIFNLILYRRPDEAAQSSGVSLGYTLTWIMSQRILIHLRDAAAAHNRTVTTQLVVSRILPTAQSVSRAMRSQFEPKDRHHHHRWRRSARTRADGVLSSGFDLDLGSGADFDWSATSSCCSSSSSSCSSAATSCRHCREGDARSSRPEADVEKGAGTGACPREWAPDRHGARVSVESGVAPVANATLDARRRGAGPGGSDGGRESDEEEEVPVRVQIEETVTVEVEYDPDAFARESYRTPRLLWETRRTMSRVGAVVVVRGREFFWSSWYPYSCICFVFVRSPRSFLCHLPPTASSTLVTPSTRRSSTHPSSETTLPRPPQYYAPSVVLLSPNPRFPGPNPGPSAHIPRALYSVQSLPVLSPCVPRLCFTAYDLYSVRTSAPAPPGLILCVPYVAYRPPPHPTYSLRALRLRGFCVHRPVLTLANTATDV